jgi:hypothetical protein
MSQRPTQARIVDESTRDVVLSKSNLPDGRPDCGTVYLGQALTVQELQPWLSEMIMDANPFP